MQNRNRIIAVAALLIVAASMITVAVSATITQGGYVHARYIVKAPVKTPAWLILTSFHQPIVVSSNYTAFPRPTQMYSYPTLAALTDAINASYHEVNPINWRPPSGWFYDSVNNILYIELVSLTRYTEVDVLELP